MAKTKKATSRKNSVKKKVTKVKSKVKPKAKAKIKPAAESILSLALFKHAIAEIMARLNHLKEQLNVIEEYADINNLQKISSKSQPSVTLAQTAPSQKDLFDVAEDVAPGGNGETEITKEEVTQALQEVQAKYGTPKVKEILASYNAKVVSAIPKNEYPNVITACKNIEEPQPAA